MDIIEFIEKYCQIKDKNDNTHSIHLSSAQKRLVKYLKQTKVIKRNDKTI